MMVAHSTCVLIYIRSWHPTNKGSTPDQTSNVATMSQKQHYWFSYLTVISMINWLVTGRMAPLLLTQHGWVSSVDKLCSSMQGQSGALCGSGRSAMHKSVNWINDFKTVKIFFFFSWQMVRWFYTVRISNRPCLNVVCYAKFTLPVCFIAMMCVSRLLMNSPDMRKLSVLYVFCSLHFSESVC